MRNEQRQKIKALKKFVVSANTGIRLLAVMIKRSWGPDKKLSERVMDFNRRRLL